MNRTRLCVACAIALGVLAWLALAGAPATALEGAKGDGKKPAPAAEKGPKPRGRSREYLAALDVISQAKAKKAPSRSTGVYYGGGLENAAELPAKGFGYRFSSGTRKTHFGSDRMVYGLIELAALLQERRPGSPWLSIGDISKETGGKLDPHINHQDGCDVDIAFLYATRQGAPAQKGWLACDEKGDTKEKAIVFDVARNYEMLSLWLESEWAGQGFEWIFVYEPLKRLLVTHGRELAAREKDAKKKEAATARCDALEKALRQPESSPHADHFHVRVQKVDEAAGAGEAGSGE